MKRIALLAASLLALGGHCAHAQSAAWPDKPMRWIVPSAAGGPLDTMGRRVAQAVSERLGQPIVVENRPGAGGSIGAAAVAKSPPDGYTFLFSQADSLINSVSLIKDLPYDPRRDFVLITQVTTTGAVLMAHPDVPGATLADTLRAARTQGAAALSYGSWGPGSYTHLAGATLAKRSETPLVHVPYKGGAPAMQDMLAKQISLAFAPPSAAMQFAKKGQAKLLAITGGSRSPMAPEVPTFAEQGYADPLFRVGIWFGLSAPAKTPPSIVASMYTQVAAALREPALVRFIADSGAEVVGSTPERFKADFEQEYALVNQAIRDAGVTPE